MLWNTYLVLQGAGLKTSRNTALDIQITLNWAYHGTLFHPGVAQFAFWLLQRDADFDRAWTDYDGTV